MIKEKGGRGPILNLQNKNNWFKNINKKHKLEKSIKWDLAIVKKVNKFDAVIETENKEEGIINYKEITWTKKDFEDLLKKGDVIYVKKIKDKQYSLKQLPKINGGIVVLDPYTGRGTSIKWRF